MSVVRLPLLMPQPARKLVSVVRLVQRGHQHGLWKFSSMFCLPYLWGSVTSVKFEEKNTDPVGEVFEGLSQVERSRVLLQNIVWTLEHPRVERRVPNVTKTLHVVSIARLARSLCKWNVDRLHYPVIVALSIEKMGKRWLHTQ